MSLFDYLISLFSQVASQLKHRWAIYRPHIGWKKSQNLPIGEVKKQMHADFTLKYPIYRKRLVKYLGKLDCLEALAYCAACGLVPANREKLADTEYLAINILEFAKENGKKLSPTRFYKLDSIASQIKYQELFDGTTLEAEHETVSEKLENIAVRGTGRNPQQSFKTAFRRFEPHNQWLVNNLGFSIQDAIEFSKTIISLLSNKLDTTLGYLNAKQKNIFQELTLNFEWTNFAYPKREFAHKIREAFSFKAKEITVSEVKRKALLNFLKRISGIKTFYKAQQSFGDEINLYEKPIVKTGEDDYFVPFPSLIIEGLPHFFYTDLANDKAYWSKNARLKGKAAEEKILELLYSVFLKDFIFPNPPKKKGEELIDALVLFDDCLFLVESKSKYLSRIARKNHQIVSTYIEENIEKGLKQAQNAETIIKSGSIKSLTNARGVQMNIDPTRIKRVYHLLILDERFSPILLSDFLASHPEYCSNLPYVVDINDIEILAKHLDTPPELIRYLEDRQKFLQSHKYRVASELDLFGYYRMHGRNFPPVQDEDKADLVWLDGCWESYQEKYGQLIEEKVSADRLSYFIDGVLENAHKAGAKSIIMAEQLSKLTRPERRLLSKLAFEKSMLSAQDGKPHYGLYSSESIDFGIVYLFSPELEVRRRELLSLLCSLASYKLGVTKIIGVAMPPANQKKGSTDFCQFRKPEGADLEAEKMAEEFFGPAKQGIKNEYPRLSKNK